MMSPAPGISPSETEVESISTVKHNAPEECKKDASFDWQKMRLNVEDPEQLAIKVIIKITF